MTSARNAFDEGFFWDSGGRRFKRVNEMVEPDVVVGMLAEGVPALVEWCYGRRIVKEPSEVLNSTVLPILAGRTEYRRWERKKNRATRTAFVAEEWNDDSGGRLLILFEGPPTPRAHNWFY